MAPSPDPASGGATLSPRKRGEGRARAARKAAERQSLPRGAGGGGQEGQTASSKRPVVLHNGGR
ncbi:MAG: hypothetical protein O9972_22375, partial [Burkholderiales bacterium]|nr:hypothetical protein [Burkholderiales bacterium]